MDIHTIKKIHQKYQLDDALPIIAKAGDVLFLMLEQYMGLYQIIQKKLEKQFCYSCTQGKDEIMPKSKHTNIQLALREKITMQQEVQYQY
ncbi:MAG: hypothetical protein CM15mP4_0960 [Candidatus Neomarinimicrobiota bacterium]|nr:MAG: hypothetical protein CM15mP4_0960 [Candidatus Neomarinimicrobiota bacterium]